MNPWSTRSRAAVHLLDLQKHGGGPENAVHFAPTPPLTCDGPAVHVDPPTGALGVDQGPGEAP